LSDRRGYRRYKEDGVSL